MTVLIYIIMVISLAGCFGHNAEYIQWDKDGNKICQVRTGEFAVAYWFGMEHYGVKKDPNSFEVGVEGYYAKSDPNSIEATGKAGGQLIGTSINRIGGL